jgi:hypothetical protein
LFSQSQQSSADQRTPIFSGASLEDSRSEANASGWKRKGWSDSDDCETNEKKAIGRPETKPLSWSKKKASNCFHLVVV